MDLSRIRDEKELYAKLAERCAVIEALALRVQELEQQLKEKEQEERDEQNP